MAKSRRTQPSRSDAAAGFFRRVPWLSVVGGVLLFTAWSIDSFFASARAAALHELDLFQSRVSTNEVLKNQWQAEFLKERLSPERDSLVVATAALAYIQFASNVMATAARAVAPTTLPLEEQAQRRRSLHDTAKARFKSGDFSGVVSLALAVEKLETEAAPDLTEAFAKQYAILKQEEQWYRTLFLGTYVIGSFIVGAAFLWSYRNRKARPNSDLEATARN